LSYNGSGTFSINTAGQPVVTGTVISSTAFNALTADLATGLSTAITKDGQTTTTVRVPFAQGISSTLVTDATSATTGSIITAGGISCQKQAIVGTNLGVGSAPLSPLANRADVTINGASAGAILTLGSAGTRVAYLATDGTNVSLSNDTATGFLRFLTVGTEVARIDSSGNLLVGTTTALGKFTLQTATGGGGYTQFIRNTAATNSSGTLLYINGQASSNTSYYMIQTDDNSQLTMRVRGDGNITNLNNSYGAISDVKLKENIVDASPKLAALMQVKVRSYNLKTNPDCKHLGVIAQELETVFPAMIEESADRDKDNNDLGTTTKSVKYSVFVPMLIKAIQELTARLAALENK
jgi:hypothetical protein